MAAHGSVTLLLARFSDLFARGLRACIDEDPALDVLADDVAPDRLGSRLAALEPDVAILNLAALEAVADVRRFHAAHPGVHLLVIAERPTDAEVDQVLACGAGACLSKEAQARDVRSAIHLASRGLVVLPRAGAETGPRRYPEVLTAREAEVLRHLQRGDANAEIAAALHVGVETVRTHRRNVYRKLGVRSRRELSDLSSG